MTTEFVPHNSVFAVTSPSRASFCLMSAPAHGEMGSGSNGRGNSHE